MDAVVGLGPSTLMSTPDSCMVHGPLGSGKSALLLALTGRFALSGLLTIDGVDAIHDRFEAMQMTSMSPNWATIRPEDRLTWPSRSPSAASSTDSCVAWQPTGGRDGGNRWLPHREA